MTTNQTGEGEPPWRIVLTKRATKDAELLKRAGLSEKGKQLFDILRRDPFATPPGFEPLLGRMAGAYSRRINLQHRLVYEVLAAERTVKILRMWTHYE